jgi:hypothetical protein
VPVCEDLRLPVIGALAELAGSRDDTDRTVAGQCLAAFADHPHAAALLPGLVLDETNTWVTLVTAEALCRRQDAAGLALVAAAIANADQQHLDWIATAVNRVFFVYAHERDAAIEVCADLADNRDTATQQGLPRLRATLIRIVPVLHPAQPSDDRTT